MLQTLGIVSGVLAAIAHLPYIRDILRKHTKPERASWLIWSVLGSIAFFSQLAKGATNSLWLNFLDTLPGVIIFALSLKFGFGGLLKRDIISLIVAAIGLILWWYFQEAAYALFLVILVDTAGAVPTIIKSYEKPETETFSTWVILVIAGLLAAMSVGTINPVLLSYPLYIAAINGSVAFAILLGRNKKK